MGPDHYPPVTLNLSRDEVTYLLRHTVWLYDPVSETVLNKLNDSVRPAGAPSLKEKQDG